MRGGGRRGAAGGAAGRGGGAAGRRGTDSLRAVTTVDGLLLVDVQAAFVSGESAVPQAGRLLAAADLLLERARDAGALIVHLQNDGGPGSSDEPGTAGWELYMRPAPSEPVIRKTRDDGFAGISLGALLGDRSVTSLAVAGVMSEMCVAATARAAIERGYRVVLPHDAHAGYDIPPGPGSDDPVPAHVVARVAEWSLGEEVVVVRAAEDVHFAG